jgi:hypothetical protein
VLLPGGFGIGSCLSRVLLHITKHYSLSCRANKSGSRSRDGQRGGKNERQSALPDLAKIAATKVNR